MMVAALIVLGVIAWFVLAFLWALALVLLDIKHDVIIFRIAAEELGEEVVVVIEPIIAWLAKRLEGRAE